MKCLSEYQLEQVLNNKKSLKVLLWNQHLKSCVNCQKRLEDIEKNLNFAKSVNWGE